MEYIGKITRFENKKGDGPAHKPLETDKIIGKRATVGEGSDPACHTKEEEEPKSLTEQCWDGFIEALRCNHCCQNSEEINSVDDEVMSPKDSCNETGHHDADIGTSSIVNKGKLPKYPDSEIASLNIDDETWHHNAYVETSSTYNEIDSVKGIYNLPAADTAIQAKEKLTNAGMKHQGDKHEDVAKVEKDEQAELKKRVIELADEWKKELKAINGGDHEKAKWDNSAIVLLKDCERAYDNMKEEFWNIFKHGEEDKEKLVEIADRFEKKLALLKTIGSLFAPKADVEEGEKSARTSTSNILKSIMHSWPDREDTLGEPDDCDTPCDSEEETEKNMEIIKKVEINKKYVKTYVEGLRQKLGDSEKEALAALEKVKKVKKEEEEIVGKLDIELVETLGSLIYAQESGTMRVSKEEIEKAKLQMKIERAKYWDKHASENNCLFQERHAAWYLGEIAAKCYWHVIENSSVPTGREDTENVGVKSCEELVKLYDNIEPKVWEKIACYAVAAAVTPNARDLYQTLGKAYEEVEQYEQAAQSYIERLRRNTQLSTEVFRLLANVYSKLGKPGAELECFKLVVEKAEVENVDGEDWCKLAEMYNNDWQYGQAYSKFKILEDSIEKLKKNFKAELKDRSENLRNAQEKLEGVKKTLNELNDMEGSKKGKETENAQKEYEEAKNAVDFFISPLNDAQKALEELKNREKTLKDRISCGMKHIEEKTQFVANRWAEMNKDGSSPNDFGWFFSRLANIAKDMPDTPFGIFLRCNKANKLYGEICKMIESNGEKKHISDSIEHLGFEIKELEEIIEIGKKLEKVIPEFCRIVTNIVNEGNLSSRLIGAEETSQSITSQLGTIRECLGELSKTEYKAYIPNILSMSSDLSPIEQHTSLIDELISSPKLVESKKDTYTKLAASLDNLNSLWQQRKSWSEQAMKNVLDELPILEDSWLSPQIEEKLKENLPKGTAGWFIETLNSLSSGEASQEWKY